MTATALLVSTDTGFRAAHRALRRAQKPGAGVPAYMRWVNRPAGRVVAAGAFALGWTPNAVTAVSAALSAAGLLLVASGSAAAWVGPAAALLLAAGFAFDSADGQLARLTGTGGRAGEWLDHVVDAVRTPALHLAVIAGAASTVPGIRWFGAVAAAFCLVGVGQFMSQVLAEQLSGRVHAAEQGAGVRKSLLGLPTDTGVLCWVFLLWGVPQAFVVAYTALLALTAVHAVVSMRRKHRHLASFGSGA